ncbi:2-hydroxyacid dehydrogenase [Vreelandella malpeensis]|uniref:D-glycerate dehydrogenase n=1 Tax=Vreelandella malpeensis TaxID=1172368 RepID=A0ABS8DMN1_9GAMM|nr:D-glycerate dehydrogenase [Halomonas malpeensis]MCB8887576.1 D-glycerate dehydrogenase [Halomonas malpeensis]
MKKRVVAVRRLHAEQLARLEREHHVDYFGELDQHTMPAFLEKMQKAHALIGGKLDVDEELLARAEYLEMIATISVGYDNFPVEALTRRGIAMCNTPDVLTETTADTGFALIMTACRRMAELDRWVREGKWQSHVVEAQFGFDVHGKTLGIIGLGRIGAAVARRGALGFNMPVLYSGSSPKPHVEEELGATHCSLEALLTQSDIVCVTVPLSSETHHLLGAQAFKMMKSSAVFINISRGAVVDEPALIHALETGEIRSAGLDVFEQEPLSLDSPLLNMPQIVLAPHIGSATHETRRSMVNLAIDNLLAGLAGQRPPNIVNPSAWASTQ